MPFQPFNYATIAPQGNPLMRNLVDTLMKGYQAGQVPTNTKLSQQQAELGNKKSQMELDYLPQEKQLAMALQNMRLKYAGPEAEARMALMEAQRQRALRPANEQLSGIAREVFGIKSLEEKLGADNPYVIEAKQLMQQKLAQGDMLNKYRQSLIDTSGKRASTSTGKLIQEQDDVASGFMPGTNRTVPLSPEDQETLAGNIGLALNKATTDSDTRKKSLFASNIDKTMEQIDPNALTQYAGAKGAANLKAQEALAPFGLESQGYRDYSKSLTGAKLLAKQVRQFYGDSITPGIQEGLSQLTNPSSWRNNPKIAKQSFDYFANLLKKESSTYRGAQRSTEEFGKPPFKSKNSAKNSDPLGIR